MQPDLITSLTPERLRAALPTLLARNLTDPEVARACEVALTELVSRWTTADAELVVTAFREAGAETRLYPTNHVCRDLSRAWSAFAAPKRTVIGIENLRAAVAHGPTVLVANHASYIDSPLLDALLGEVAPDVADQVVHITGPKVYQATFRRIAIICLNALPVQQSSAVKKPGAEGGEVEKVSPRELAREVEKTLQAAEAALLSGHHLLLYPEGSRTRTGRMGTFLKGTYRYLRVPGTHIVPLALEGTSSMMGVGSDNVTPTSCKLTCGAPISVEEADGPRRALELAELSVARLLPPELRPEDFPG